MRLFVHALVVLGWLLSTPHAWACAAVGHAGAYVRLSREQTLIVWDEDAGVEHFVRRPVFEGFEGFEGDPRDFGFLVPTPAVPAIGKVSDAVWAELEGLVPYAEPVAAQGRRNGPAAAAALPVQVEQRVRIDDYELVTLRASDAGALVDWLKKNEFASRPSLALWADKYVRRGWVLNAMRYAPSGARAGKVETPTVRLSFEIAAPFYPYTESPPDPSVEEQYLARTGVPMADRRLDLWVVSPRPLEMRGRGNGNGPSLVGAAIGVPGAALTLALGDHASNPSRRTWTVTRYVEQTSRRTAFEDLSWSPPGAVEKSDSSSEGRSRRIGLAIAALAVLLALGVAILTDRSSPAERK
jgi:hypothetical protein